MGTDPNSCFGGPLSGVPGDQNQESEVTNLNDHFVSSLVSFLARVLELEEILIQQREELRALIDEVCPLGDHVVEEPVILDPQYL